MPLTFHESSPNAPEARPLLLALSAELLRITGNDGDQSFMTEDVQAARSVFLIALEGEEPVGCGGLRPLSPRISVRSNGCMPDMPGGASAADF